MELKQMIIMRKDLNMRKGKMIAQGCHASLGVYIDYHKQYLDLFDDWIVQGQKKVCVSVDSYNELLNIYSSVGNIPKCLITDSGLTEFNNIPTITCCALGPWNAKELDDFTGNLKLL